MKNFFKKLILLIRGQLPDYNEYANVTKALYDERKRVRALQEQLGITELDLQVSGFDDLSHEPTDAKERMQYAARVSEFYEEILKNKIRTSIAEIRESLAAVGTGFGLPQNMTRTEYDFLLRGMEAGLWKIHDWATLLQGELKNKE